jgi:phosphoribosylformylglycinamidine synthase
LIGRGLVASCHDISDGGLLVALAEMAMAGGLGATLDPPSGIAAHAWLFGEDQARYIIEMSAELAVQTLAAKGGVPIRRIGTVGGVALTLPGGGAISVAQLKAAHEAWLPDYMHQG